MNAHDKSTIRNSASTIQAGSATTSSSYYILDESGCIGVDWDESGCNNNNNNNNLYI